MADYLLRDSGHVIGASSKYLISTSLHSMSKDLVRLLKLQDSGKPAPRPSHGGIDESFGVIGQELDALTSKVRIASEHRDKLERKAALQGDELSSLRQALKESEATCWKLKEVASSLQAQLNRGFDPGDESETDRKHEQGRGTPIQAADSIVGDLHPCPETGIHENLTAKNVPAEWKQEGPDWLAVFNPNAERTLNITLVETFKYNSPVSCVRLSPNVKYLAAACASSVHIYNARTGVRMRAFETNTVVTVICFSPDSSILAIGSHDEEFVVLTTATWEIGHTFGGNTRGVSSLCFSPDGALLVAGTYNEARIWSLQDRTCRVVSASPRSLISISLSKNGFLAMGCGNGLIEIWSQGKNKPQLVETIVGHERAVKCLAFVPHPGKGLLSASADKSLKYWDVSELLGSNMPFENPRKGADYGLLSPCMVEFNGHQESVTSFAISHNNQWLVSGSEDHCVQFWDLKTGTSRCMLKGHTDFITSVDLSQTGNVLVTGSKDGQLRMWTYM